MDRNKRTVVVVFVAVLLAAVASLGMYRVVSARPASAGNAVKTVDVVVAQHPLPLGTRLTGTTSSWPSGRRTRRCPAPSRRWRRSWTAASSRPSRRTNR